MDPITNAQGATPPRSLDDEGAALSADEWSSRAPTPLDLKTVDLMADLVRKAGEQDEAIVWLTRVSGEQAEAIDDLRAKLALVEAALAVQAETNRILGTILDRLNDGLRPDGSPMLAAGEVRDGR